LIKKLELMKYNTHIRLLVILFFLPAIVWAQEERQYIREGYKAYMNEKYSDAEVAFQKAKNVDSTSFIASYNLGGSFYKSEKYEQAQSSYSKLAEADVSAKEKAHLFYNLGNTQVKQAILSMTGQNMQEATEFLKQALESYKQSLLLNPKDKEAKYNYMLTKELLKKLQEQNQEQNQENQQNQEENKEQNREQDEKEGSDEKDQKEGGKEDQKTQEPEISEQNAEMLLKIIEQKDEEILEKLKKIKAKKTDKKKEKDW